ncbi:MAG: hypothetical protein M3007_08565 [Candidatus Eremiobacteraeota bacterium]|nr:hypothetical protein [Candidatus Eremiobacteraeota bacterium]
MHKLRIGIAMLLCVGALSGCKTNTNPGDVKFLPPVMQLAVGTMNDSAATLNAAAGVYLNAVTTFRNSLGNSAFLSPGVATLTGPAAISVTLGSLFAYGQRPGSNGALGAPPAYVPPSTSGSGGYATGFILTGLTPPTPGSYTVVAPVTVNGQVQPWNASATLPAAFTTLGNDGGAAYVASGGGGGTFTFAAPPAGVTESVVYVSCSTTTAPPDPCGAGPGFPVASAEVTGATLTATLPAGTLVPGEVYNAFVIGADYPLFEAGPPANVQQAPTITGAGGTADLTVSPAFTITG